MCVGLSASRIILKQFFPVFYLLPGLGFWNSTTKSWLPCSLYSALSPLPKEVNAEGPSCPGWRRCCKEQRILGGKNLLIFQNIVSKTYIKLWWETLSFVYGYNYTGCQGDINVEFSASGCGSAPFHPWSQPVHLVTSTCTGKTAIWAWGTGWGRTAAAINPPTQRLHPRPFLGTECLHHCNLRW